MWWNEAGANATERGEVVLSNRQILAALLPFLRVQRGRALAAAGLVAGVTAAALAGPLVLREVINVALHGNQPTAVYQLAGLFLLTVGLRFGLELILTLVVNRAGLEMVTDLKSRVFYHVLRLPVQFFDRFTPGRLIARVESDGESVKQLFSVAAVRIFENLFLLLGIIAVMIAADWRLTLPVLGLMVFLGGLTFGFIRLIRRYHHEARARYADVASFIGEYVQGIDVIQQFGREANTGAALAELSAAKGRADSRRELYSQSFLGLFVTFETLAIAAILTVGAKRLALGELDVGTLVMFVEYIRQVFFPIHTLSEFVAQIQHGLVSGERMLGILTSAPEDPPVGETSAANAPNRPSGLQPLSGELRFEREIRLEDVSFAYSPDGPDVLHSISLTIARGQRVALVGPSGGGKSTLAGLLLRFHDPRAGRITVDGIDLTTRSRHEWREQIGLVLQEQHLLPGSLRENLTVFRADFSDQTLEAALDLVRATPILERLDGGLDGEILERGGNLSAGERQLLGFARAIVPDPPLLVLDEATASVDPQTEREIQTGLDRMLAGRTAVIIAHRLSTIINADRIVVIEGGRVVESGTHAELHGREDGRYRRLYDLQFQAEAT